MLVDITKIIAIESNFDSCKIGKAGEVGLCQITKEVLMDYNRYLRLKGGFYRQYVYPKDLFDARINIGIAQWYLERRIPEMLAAYGKPATLENVLISYNAGIKYVRDNIEPPKTTQRYIEKYNRIESDVARVKAYL